MVGNDIWADVMQVDLCKIGVVDLRLYTLTPWDAC